MPPSPSASLPAAWQEALARDELPGKPSLADPLPERRVARLLAAFISAGLVFLVLPGTLLGVWNLINISSERQADAISTAWIQAHGHAQLFGWVATFMLGICLYAFPKFRGGSLRSLPVGWAMFGIWSVAVAARWFSAVASWRWQLVWPISGTLELAAALLLFWQSTASGTSRRKRELWEVVIFAGLGGLAATLTLQLALVLRPLPSPVIPRESDLLLITLALWVFCFPVVLGFSGRLLPTFLGLRRSGIISGYAGLGLLAIAAALFTANRPQWGAVVIVGAVISACWSLRIFHPTERAAKLAGVDPLYPRFVRAHTPGWRSRRC
jgi:uncharacterized protein involved in response to NO